MRATQIDFAPVTPRRALCRAPRGVLITGVVGFLLCMMAIVIDAVTFLQRQGDAAEIAKLEARAHAMADQSSQRHGPSAEQVQAMNAIVEALNIPWTDLLNAFEVVTPEKIALLELSPDASKHTIKALAETTEPDLMLDYVNRLKQQPLLDNVILLKHEINAEEPNRPLRFEFEARWREVAR